MFLLERGRLRRMLMANITSFFTSQAFKEILGTILCSPFPTFKLTSIQALQWNEFVLGTIPASSCIDSSLSLKASTSIASSLEYILWLSLHCFLFAVQQHSWVLVTGPVFPKPRLIISRSRIKSHPGIGEMSLFFKDCIHNSNDSSWILNGFKDVQLGQGLNL